MRVGLIGAGRIGAFHARTLADHPAVTGVVVTDPLMERAEAVAADVRGSVAPDAQSMIGSIDAMVIAVDDSASDEQVAEYERSACPTCGSCSGMFTANSMNCLTEALDLVDPGRETPIVVAGDAARIGRPPEAVL